MDNTPLMTEAKANLFDMIVRYKMHITDRRDDEGNLEYYIVSVPMKGSRYCELWTCPEPGNPEKVLQSAIEAVAQYVDNNQTN